MESARCQPRLIFWEVTKGCSLSCIHCRASASGLPSPLGLPTTKGLNLTKQTPQPFLPILVLSGGEPPLQQGAFEPEL
jgi:MoaA/NifB/PqqE/SkfB family radical SAM enzyme